MVLDADGRRLYDLRLRIGENRIGRAEVDVDCQITDSPTVSAQHAILEITAQPIGVQPASLVHPFFTPHHTLLDLDSLFILDLASSNHTQVGTLPSLHSQPPPIRLVPHKQRLLRHGQYLFFGRQMCQFLLWKYEDGVRLAEKRRSGLTRRSSVDSRAPTQIEQGGGGIGDTQLVDVGGKRELDSVEESAEEPGAPQRLSPEMVLSNEAPVKDAEAALAEADGRTAGASEEFDLEGFGGDYQTLQSDDFNLDEEEAAPVTVDGEGHSETTSNKEAEDKAELEGPNANGGVDAGVGANGFEESNGEASGVEVVLSGDPGPASLPLDPLTLPTTHSPASCDSPIALAGVDVEPGSPFISPNATQPLPDESQRSLTSPAPVVKTMTFTSADRMQGRKPSARTRKVSPVGDVVAGEEERKREEVEAARLHAEEERRRAEEEEAARFQREQEERVRLREEKKRKEEEEQSREAEELQRKREKLEKETLDHVEAQRQERLKAEEKERLAAQQRRQERELQEQREEEEERRQEVALKEEKETKAALAKEEESKRRREEEERMAKEREGKENVEREREEKAAHEGALLAAEKSRSENAVAARMVWREKKSKKGVKGAHTEEEATVAPKTPPKTPLKRKRQSAAGSAGKAGAGEGEVTKKRRGGRGKAKAKEEATEAAATAKLGGIVHVLSLEQESMQLDDDNVEVEVVVVADQGRHSKSTALTKPSRTPSHPPVTDTQSKPSTRSRSASGAEVKGVSDDDLSELLPATTARSTGSKARRSVQQQESLAPTVNREDVEDDSRDSKAVPQRRTRSTTVEHQPTTPKNEALDEKKEDEESAAAVVIEEAAGKEEKGYAALIEAETKAEVPGADQSGIAMAVDVDATQQLLSPFPPPNLNDDLLPAPSLPPPPPLREADSAHLLRSMETQEALSVLDDMKEAQALTSPFHAPQPAPVEEKTTRRGRKRKPSERSSTSPSTPSAPALTLTDSNTPSIASPLTKRTRSVEHSTPTQDMTSSPSTATSARGSRRSTSATNAPQPITPTSAAVRSSSSSNKASAHLTRRLTSTSPVLLFTAIDPTPYLPGLERVGGSNITTNPSLATHLITDRVRRTDKLLAAYDCVQHIVTTQWVERSISAGRWVDPLPYALTDAEAEERWGFSLKARALHVEPLKGWRVWSTPQVKPERESMRVIVEAAGGHMMEEEPEEGNTRVLVVGCEEDGGECEELTRRGFTVWSKEAVLCGVLRQRLEPTEFVLYQPTNKQGGTGRGRGRGRGRKR